MTQLKSLNAVQVHNLYKKEAFILFIIGLWGGTQFHFLGSIGISEFLIFIIAPFVFVYDYALLREHGFLPYIWLAVLMVIRAMLSPLLNGTSGLLLLKGMASTYSLFAIPVVLHHFLWRNILNFRWFSIGSYLSGIISTFIFQPETYTGRYGKEDSDYATAAVMGNVLYWPSKIAGALHIPISCWYLQTPFWYSIIIPIITAGISLLFSGGSGRGAAAVTLLGVLIIAMGGKKKSHMQRFKKHFFTVFIVLIIAAFLTKSAYQFLASNGSLGEKARTKYEKQSQYGRGFLGTLMGGRTAFFYGTYAALKRPIVGYGVKPFDYGGIYQDFMRRYGTYEDLELFLQEENSRMKRGMVTGLSAHSHIITHWIECGIFGLIFWLYVLFLYFDTLKNSLSVKPELYGFFALAIPSAVYDLFFNPYGGRLWTCFLITMCLLIRSVRIGKIPVKAVVPTRPFDVYSG